MTDPTAIDLEVDPTKQRLKGTTRIGGQEFDVPYMTEILPHLWIGGCKTGLVLPPFIGNVVSLYPWERYTVNHELDTDLSVRMYDSGSQLLGDVESIAKWVHHLWRHNRDSDTLVHCQAGLNRSPLVVACVLMLRGMSATAAINLIRLTRSPVCLCNQTFEHWLNEVTIGEW